MTWTCALCGETFDVENDNPLDHLRLIHPDDYAPMATWPDGEPVIVDTTIEPQDFA